MRFRFPLCQFLAAAFFTPLALAGEKVNFEKEILPILDGACFKCHSAQAKKAKGDIRLDDAEEIRMKGLTDDLIFPGKPEASLLVQVMELPADDDAIMPPAKESKPLPAEQIALIRRWIAEGAEFGGWKGSAPRVKPAVIAQGPINPADVAATARQIDELVEAGLKSAGHQPNPPLADDLWCRRVHLDLIGRIPAYDEISAFLKSRDPQKRAKLIDALLASPGHVSTMFNYWCDTLRARDQLAENVRGDFYLHYLKESIRTNKPYDRWVREMVSPEGSLAQNPAVGFYLRDLGNRFASVDNTAIVFLGTQIGCAQCHNHPFDEWKQKSYHQFAAWTSGIRSDRQRGQERMSEGEVEGIRAQLEEITGKRTTSQRKQLENSISMQVFDGMMRNMTRRERDDFTVRNGTQADGKLPKDYKYSDGQPNQPVAPAVLFGEAHAQPGQRPADTFAAWLTAPENPRFALAIANRMWARLLGAPFSGTVDSVSEPAKCANPELASYLARLMVAAKFDLRQFQRIVANTRLYARQSGTPAGAAWDFAGPVMRRMSAEQIWDSIMALAVPDLDAQIDFTAPDTSGETKYGELSDAESVIDSVREEAKDLANDRLRAMRRHTRPKPQQPVMSAPELGGSPMLRASELPQPAPESHFLRVFGQSNREVADGGWRSGTVPQTLVMLNSTLFDVLVRKGTPLTEALKRESGDSGRLRAVYLSILGREPSFEDMRLISSVLNGTGNTEAIAHTLLGTRQFLFIQ
jgi:hypothetical protein